MNKSDLYSIALKILGVVSVYRFLNYLIEFIVMLIINHNTIETPVGNMDISFYVSFSVVAILELIIGLTLIIKSETIAKWISIGKFNLELGFPKKRIDLIETGFAIFSVILITYSIAELLSYFVESTYFFDHSKSEYLTEPTIRSIFHLIFKLVAGIFLLANARYFSALIVKLGDSSDAKENEN